MKCTFVYTCLTTVEDSYEWQVYRQFKLCFQKLQFTIHTVKIILEFVNTISFIFMFDLKVVRLAGICLLFKKLVEDNHDNFFFP